MKWVDACINNKLVIFGSAVLLCVLGAISIAVIPIAPFPSISVNSISISLSYPGANADTVERQVVSKIITGLQSINNIQQITANSQAGTASISLTLDSNLTQVDMLQAEMQVIQAVASSNLPSVVPEPEISQDLGQSGLVGVVLYSDKTPLFDLQNFIQGVMAPALNSLPQVFLNIDNNNAVVKIKLNPSKLAMDQIDPVTLSGLLNATYQSTPLGNLEIQEQEYVLNMPNNLTTLSELGNILVGYQYANSQDANSQDANSQGKQSPLLGQPIYLKDIADISFEPRSQIPDFIFSVNGKPATGVWVATHANANPFLITQAVDAYIQSLKAYLPEDIHILKLFDMSTIMKSSMWEVALTILISSLLVILIVLIFLGRLRTTIIPVITIPICLLGSMIIMYLCGFTLNIISLLALVIAVGLVVDDAIVVVENITRHLEHGMPKHEAVVLGTKDIAVTIIAITMTLIAVYLPILCSSSMVASLFKPFALTLAGAVLISGIAALTLTPVMSSILLDDAPLTRYQKTFDQKLGMIIRGYHRVLALILKFRKLALSVILIFIISGVYMALKLPKTIFPNDPEMEISISVNGSAEDNAESLEHKLEQFSSFYNNSPTLTAYSFNINKDPISGILTGKLILFLKPEYLTKTGVLVDKINQFIKQKNMVNTYAKAPNFSNWGDYDFSFYLYGSSDINQINQAADKITQRMQAAPQFSFVTNQINQPQKQLVFDINEPKAASLGILRESISNVLSVYYGGYTLNNYFDIANLSVPIVVQLDNQDLRDPEALQKLMIQSPVTHQYYLLSTFVSWKTIAKPLMISTLNGQPAVEINANLAGAYSLANAIPYINQLVKSQFPSLQVQYTDSALAYTQGNNQTLYIVLMGLLSVYFLLTLLFRNLIDPLIIMLTVPFSIIGGALALYCIGGSINLYSSLGLITLVGLITKHGVLIVQFANESLKKGHSVTAAVLTATHHRFRPIMMTTFAMVFGALPLVFSSEMMYKSRENLGVVIIGGLLIGTLFSLFVIPLVYVLVKKAEGVR